MNMIVSDPGIRAGKPCIKNTDISVHQIMHYIALGMMYHDIMTEYGVTHKQIDACIEYSKDK